MNSVKNVFSSFKSHLNTKKSIIDNDEPKDRQGKDLIFIFYSIVSVILFIATLQAISYHIGVYRCESLFYNNFGKLFTLLGFNINDEMFKYQLFKLPINVLLDFVVLYTLGYGGFEGSTAFIKTLSLDGGQFIQMPEKKLKRFFRFIMMWYIVAIVLSLYQMMILTVDSQLSFFVDKAFTGLGMSSMVYMYGRKAPKTVADLSIKKKTCVEEPKCDKPQEPDKQMNLFPGGN